MDDLAPRSAREIESSSVQDDVAAESVVVWPLVICGTLAAILIAWLACWVPAPVKTSGVKIFLRAVLSVLVTAQAGFMVALLVRRRAGGKAVVSPWVLSLQVGVVWVFLPCIALFYRQHSVWTLAMVVVAAAVLAVQVRDFFPDRGAQESSTELCADGVPTFAALPVERADWWRMPLVSLRAQVSLFPILRGDLFVASVLLATCSCLLAWRLSVLFRKRTRKVASERVAVRRLAGAAVVAILILWMTLIPWIGRGGGSPRGGDAGRRSSVVARGQNQATDPGFVGIILLPPDQKKVKVIPPVPHDHPVMVLKAAEPVVIPFDGPYWYYKAPHKDPGAKAHVVHGMPTMVNVHSTDWSPLLMEAHQSLGSPINPGCCREIDVNVTNADNRPGEIGIAVVLTDSGSAGRPSQYLGEKPILSSAGSGIPLNRPAVEETVRFPIPLFAKLHRFDEISVVFLPAKERSRGGAKVSIRSFRLIPR